MFHFKSKTVEQRAFGINCNAHPFFLSEAVSRKTSYFLVDKPGYNDIRFRQYVNIGALLHQQKKNDA